MNTTAAVLTLGAFLAQVQESHQGIKAARLSSESALERATQAELSYGLTAFSDASGFDDRRVNVFFAIPRTLTTSYNLGVRQTFAFGLRAQASYNLVFTQWFNAPSTVTAGLTAAGYTDTRFHESRLILDLTQSIMGRNSFGAETRAQLDAAEAGARATHFGQSAMSKNLIADAEMTYWRLVLSKENVATQTDALDRAQKIYDWNQRRQRLHLADSSDLFQAQAGLESRRLSLQAAEDDLRSAARAFNTARGQASDQIPENLERFDADAVRRASAPTKASEPDDVQAATQQSKAANAQARLGEEQNRFTFETFVQGSLFGRREFLGTSLTDAFNGSMNTFQFGARFSTPFDFSAMKTYRDAWAKERLAAELNAERKRFESDRLWADLTVKLQDALRRLELAEKLEKTQEQKVMYERDRLSRGRSTTYQVLLFEQEFRFSQLTRLQTQSEILSLIARMKTFG